MEPGKEYEWTFTPTDSDNYESVTGFIVLLPATYTVTVMGGTGSGKYKEGATVTITANAPAAGKQFAGWTSNDVTLTNANAASTMFVMPAKAVTVTANYMNKPEDAPITPDVNPLVITLQPVDQMVAPSENAKFSIWANGDGLTYQWYINRNDGRGWVKLQGATNAVYETSAADLVYDGFQYVC